MRMSNEQEKQAKAMRRLLTLAKGDTRLIDRAIKATTARDATADVDAVIRWILEHRDEKIRA
jgi:hypothetical protein